MSSRLAALCGLAALLLSVAPAFGTCPGDSATCVGDVFEDASLIALRHPKDQKNRPISSGSRFGRSASAGGAPVNGAELMTTGNYKYGRFEVSSQWAGADGVISSFFLWKPYSERNDESWNELDYEKLGLRGDGNCKMGLNMIGGNPGPDGNGYNVDLSNDICSTWHTYAFEWTSDYIVYLVDGVQVRREEGWNVQNWNSYNSGMEFHFNLWVGDWRFGGTFNEGSLPLYQYIDWVKYYSWDQQSNSFILQWEEGFNNDTMPAGWTGASWTSPLGHSEHKPENILFKDGHAVLALTPTSMGVPSLDEIPAPGPPQPNPPQPKPQPNPPQPNPPQPNPSGEMACCWAASGSCGGCTHEDGWCSDSEGNCGQCGAKSKWCPLAFMNAATATEKAQFQVDAKKAEAASKLAHMS